MLHFTVTLFYIVMLSLGKGSALNRNEYVKGLDTLKEHLVKELGFSQEPDVDQVEVTNNEYDKMRRVYDEMLRLTNEIKKVKKKFKKLRYTTPSKHNLLMTSSTEDDVSGIKVMFDTNQINNINFGVSLVQTATLKLHLKRTNHFSTSKVKVLQNIFDDEGAEIASVDLSENMEENVTVSFDVSDALQSWFLDHNSQRGFTVEADGFELIVHGELQPTIFAETLFSLTRQKRSLFPGFFQLEDDADADNDQDCDATSNKCCRDDMIVNLRELDGFNFILEPTEFNAYMCRGKCPARYRPLNDHSLLQSLMHIKQQNDLIEGFDEQFSKVKRPCCVPSKLSSLPILHLDEKNPSKLKVTTWKSIIVTECSCG